MPAPVQLGPSPLHVSPLGVGCWAWGDSRFWEYDERNLRDVVDAFGASVEAGVDLFDTAEVYGWGKSEQLVGALVRKSWRPVMVATKYAPLDGRGGARAIPKALEASLKRLGLPRIDLYQVHWPNRDELPIGEAMDVLADLVHAGKIRAVGVSNYSAGEMRDAHAALERRGVPLATNQVHYSLLHRAPEVDGVRETCRELGVTLLAYSPLEQGLLSGKYTPDALPSGPRAEVESFSAANVAAAQSALKRLRAIADARGVDAAAVAIAWLMAMPGVVPIPGAKTAAQASGNAKALGVVLSSEEIAQLDEATKPWCTA